MKTFLKKRKIKKHLDQDFFKLLQLIVRTELITKYSDTRITAFLLYNGLTEEFTMEFIKPLYNKYGDGLSNGSIDFRVFKGRCLDILKVGMDFDSLGGFFIFQNTNNQNKWEKLNNEFNDFRI